MRAWRAVGVSVVVLLAARSGSADEPVRPPAPPSTPATPVAPATPATPVTPAPTAPTEDPGGPIFEGPPPAEFEEGAEIEDLAGPGLDEGAAAFGPLIAIERIDVRGNRRTAERLIRRALVVKEGDTLRAGDPRFVASRFRVLALGYFTDVQLGLARGSRRGAVVLEVRVVERGTLTLRRLFWGTSEATPLWVGVDAGDTNFFGTGLGISGAVLWAAPADIDGATAQLALRLRYRDPSVFGLPLGVRARALWNDASEPYRIGGAPGDAGPANFRAFRYTRRGGVGGVSYEATRDLSLTADARLELVDAELPTGRDDLQLAAGRSRVASVIAGLLYDTRVDPVLTSRGTRLRLWSELGAEPIGSYTFLLAQGQLAHWVPVGGRRHVVSGQLSAGVIAGDAPRFDRFHAGDWSGLLPPRPLDLVVSTRASWDLFATGRQPETYGRAAASAVVEYSYRLFRRPRRIYGGDLYVGAGVLALGRPDEVEPFVDLLLDAGLRLDTAIGVFELGLANAIGRIPL